MESISSRNAINLGHTRRLYGLGLRKRRHGRRGSRAWRTCSPTSTARKQRQNIEDDGRWQFECCGHSEDAFRTSTSSTSFYFDIPVDGLQYTDVGSFRTTCRGSDKMLARSVGPGFRMVVSSGLARSSETKRCRQQRIAILDSGSSSKLNTSSTASSFIFAVSLQELLQLAGTRTISKYSAQTSRRDLPARIEVCSDHLLTRSSA